jgi:hypothetical protein
MGLVLPRPFDPGTLLEVELQGKGRRTLVPTMRVVHVRKHENGWLFGCALETELGPADLAALL